MGRRFRVVLEQNRLGQIGGKVRRRLDACVRQTAAEIEAHAREAIEGGPKSGRTYSRGGRQHQASAPGQGPATDTGHLAGSIRSQGTGAGAAEVTVGAEYATALELGSADGRIAPRPFLGPAGAAAEPGFRTAAAQAVREGVGE